MVTLDSLPKPRRILHVLSTPRAEGTPNLVLDWLAAGTGYYQAVMVLNSQPADLTDQLRSAADAYEEHNFYTAGRRKFPAITKATYAAVKKHRPDVVVCWPTGFANWACLGAWLAGARRLLVHCGNPPNRGRRNDWMSRYGFWPLSALRAKCICCSNYVREELQAIPWVSPRLFHTVWNCSRGAAMATAAQRGRALRNGAPARRAIMVATLEVHKDHETLLQAVPAIVARVPSFELWLVGAGTLRAKLEATITELGVGAWVKLLGRRTDVGELLGQSDVFVLSTTPQEGLGSVLIEALAAGLPVVASDVPACREALVDGRYGRLAPPRDPQALADAVVASLNTTPDALEPGQQFALELSPQRMIAAYLSLAYGGKA